MLCPKDWEEETHSLSRLYWVEDIMATFKYLKSFFVKNRQDLISLCGYKSHMWKLQGDRFQFKRRKKIAKAEIGCSEMY